MKIEINIKKLPDSEVEIIGIVPIEIFEECRGLAVKELAQSVKIDGFRDGMAPESVLAKKIGEHAILEKMADICLRKEYPKIIEENKIKVIGRPEISITKIARDNPLEFKAKISVLPEINLPDYKKISLETAKKKENIDVKEEEIDKIIDYLRKSRAEKDAEGKEILAELNDEFAKSVGKFETMDELRKHLSENIRAEQEIKEKQRQRIDILDKIIQKTEMETPKILIEAERRKMLEEMKANIAQAGLKWEDYLAHIKKTEEEVVKDWDKDAIKRVKYGLILNEIAEKEKIEVPEEKLDKETDKILEQYQGMDIDRERAKAYTYGIIRNEKVFNLLEKTNLAL